MALENASGTVLCGGCQAAELKPLKDWHEDIGDALWWRFPVNDAPYVGSPLDTYWPGYHTHWQRIVVPPSPSDPSKGGR